MDKNTVPAWLRPGTDAITVTLSRAEAFNGVKTNQLVLRAPTVRDMRGAQKLHPDDVEERELALFASLAQVAPADLEQLKLTDYNRLQDAYFRLVSDAATESAAGARPGHAAGA
ncbi:phage tail assembly protein [Pseudoduganella namucuonensis]|uniref:Phage tail assembly chaperone protein, E, or 41 or 14 n=1 Tax=Pseudoduganella namucuonensis TaxID=1035707 RepID=A0A1I7J3L0_9BURK|nr:phage tail assembly protein [Pseudoduganella namucuonensis]SFU79721.1 Phage tail assembly chaperone protein, E, or 41 or 14 [Pseudoduganella namucuonensis]